MEKVTRPPVLVSMKNPEEHYRPKSTRNYVPVGIFLLAMLRHTRTQRPN